MVGPEDVGGSGKDKPQNPSANPGSPYYVHPTNYPHQMHVNDSLNDNNYADWSREMRDFIVIINKVGFIDGTIPTPIEDHPEYRACQCIDAIIKGWITTTIDMEIRNSVKYATTTRQIWEYLQERFRKESVPRAYELKRILTNMREEKHYVPSYFIMMRGIQDEIESTSPSPTYTCDNCSCNLGKRLIESKETERIYEFLIGLDDKFRTIKTQILITKRMLNLGTVYHLVVEDEQQKNISATRKPVVIVEAAAFQIRQSQNLEGNHSNKCTSHKNLKCKHGNKVGHVIEGCFEKIMYPDWWEN